MDDLFYLRPVLALIIVCCLIGLAALAAKKLRLEERLTSRVIGAAKKQLAVIETLTIDHKHKAILLKRGNTGHLLVIGPQGETVVESNIPLNAEVIPLQEVYAPASKAS